jgi:Trk K+ transport system NAD-binding subunit
VTDGGGYLFRAVGAALRTAFDRQVQIVVTVLLALVVVSTAVLTHHRDGQGGMGVVDAVYFTVETVGTVGTVGYGDFSFREQPTWLRIYAIGLMLVGAVMATLIYALLTNALVSRRLEEQLPQLRRLGVPVVIGDATLRSTLESANVARAGAVALLTSNDLTNLETGIAVRDLAGDHREIPIVLRVYDRQLARTVASGFGFRQVRSTAALAAPWFVGEALGLEVISTFYVGDQLLLIGQITVAAGSELDGIAMDSLGADVRVVAITRHGTTERRDLPRRATRMFAGDIAHLVGGCEDLFRVVRRNAPAAQV